MKTTQVFIRSAPHGAHFGDRTCGSVPRAASKPAALFTFFPWPIGLQPISSRDGDGPSSQHAPADTPWRLLQPRRSFSRTSARSACRFLGPLPACDARAQKALHSARAPAVTAQCVTPPDVTPHLLRRVSHPAGRTRSDTRETLASSW